MLNSFLRYISLLIFPLALLATDVVDKSKKTKREYPFNKSGLSQVKILEIIDPDLRFAQTYPYALKTLLNLVDQETSVPIETVHDTAPNFEEESIFDYPFIYMNYASRKEWKFSKLEKENLRKYLERGGFIYIDAGINAEFLQQGSAGQHHSFAEWRVCPPVGNAFKEVFKGSEFEALKRSHPLFKSFYKGLPNASVLPDTVREFVVNEKWPKGTFSAVGLKVKGRIAVLCTPIISMGWGRDSLGNWRTTIGFRIRESAEGLDAEVAKIDPSDSYKTVREDSIIGKKDTYDTIYCVEGSKPAFVREPNGKVRAFRYYHSTEISNFAHQFYSRLGVNILVYGLMH